MTGTFPAFNTRARRAAMRDRSAPFVVCPDCGFAATLVDAPGYPLTSAWERLAKLLDSGCTGCPSCPGDLRVHMPELVG